MHPSWPWLWQMSSSSLSSACSLNFQEVKLKDLQHVLSIAELQVLLTQQMNEINVQVSKKITFLSHWGLLDKLEASFICVAMHQCNRIVVSSNMQLQRMCAGQRTAGVDEESQKSQPQTAYNWFWWKLFVQCVQSSAAVGFGSHGPPLTVASPILQQTGRQRGFVESIYNREPITFQRTCPGDACGWVRHLTQKAC